MEVKKLQQLAHDGVLLYDVADAMGWEFQRVQYWEKRLALRFKRGRRPAIDIQDATKLQKLAASGLSLYAAAERMGWDWRKVWRWEKRLGLQFKRFRGNGK